MPVSAYNRFIAAKCKGGKMTLTQAARLWSSGRKSSVKPRGGHRRVRRGKGMLGDLLGKILPF